MREKIKYRLKVWKGIQPFASGVQKYVLLSFLTGLFVMELGFVQPLFYKLFIDRVILDREFSWMPLVAAGYLAILLLQTEILRI